jgi:hypothetical protein
MWQQLLLEDQHVCFDWNFQPLAEALNTIVTAI